MFTRLAFTVVEVLIATAVLGVITAIGVVCYLDLNESSRTVKAKSNAQTAARIFHSARAAGADVPGTTKEEILDTLQAGVTGTGSFHDSKFQFTLQGENRDDALQWLKLEGGELINNTPE